MASHFDAKGYRVYNKHDSGFDAMLGSILEAQMLRILLDHKAAFGYRVMEKVVVLAAREEADTKEFGKQRSFLIVLFDPRPQPQAATQVLSFE